MELSRSNFVRERLLLQGKQRRDTLEYLKFVAGIKAQLLDRSQSDEVTAFNELMGEIGEFYYPGSKKPKKTWQEQVKVMEDFKKFKGTKFSLKDFKKAT